MERVIFSCEFEPERGVRLILCGEWDELLLDALTSFIALQHKANQEKGSANVT